MTIFSQTFTAAQVAEAADIKPATLQNWIKRGLVIGHKDAPIDKPGKAGVRRRFSFFNVMEVAVGAALVHNGVPLTQAMSIGSTFAHAGGSNGTAEGMERRLPSLPYRLRAGLTIICFNAEHSFEMLLGDDDRQAYLAFGKAVARGFLSVMPINPLFYSVVSRLGFSPHDVLRDAYGEDE